MNDRIRNAVVLALACGTVPGCHLLFKASPLTPIRSSDNPVYFEGTGTPGSMWPGGSGLAASFRNSEVGHVLAGAATDAAGNPVETLTLPDGKELAYAPRVWIHKFHSEHGPDLVLAGSRLVALDAQGDPFPWWAEHYFWGKTVGIPGFGFGLEGSSESPIGSFQLGSQPFPAASFSAAQLLHEPWVADEAVASEDLVTDWRFQGTYKGGFAHTIQNVPVIGEVEVTAKELQFRLDHAGPELLPLAGTLTARTAFWIETRPDIQTSDVLENYNFKPKDLNYLVLLVAGEVTGPGTASALVTVFNDHVGKRFEDELVAQPWSARAWLSLTPDGNTLQMQVLGKAFTFTKLGADLSDDPANPMPNGLPSVTVVSPPPGAAFPASQAIDFECAVVDEGAPATADMREIRWEIRKGPHGEWHQFGDTLPDATATDRARVRWSPSTGGDPWPLRDTGVYTVRVSAMDAGGLIAVDERSVTLLPEPPPQPVIELPADDELYVGAPAVFLGKATDSLNRILTGPALTWFWRVDAPIAASAPLGSPNEGVAVEHAFAQPGAVVVTLVATDENGLSSSAQRTFDVLPATGNAPPTARVLTPDPTQLRISATRGTPMLLLGEAKDLEDDDASLQVEWRVSSAGSPATTISNTPLAAYTWPDNGETKIERYRVTFSVEDSAGASSTHGVVVNVYPKGFTIE